MKNMELAKELVELDKSFLDMGDSYEEIVENTCFIAGYSKSDCEDEETYEELEKTHEEAYKILLDRKDGYIKEYVSWLLEHQAYEIERNLVYNYTNNIQSTSEYRCLKALHEHLISNDMDEVLADKLGVFIRKLENKDMHGIYAGYKISHEYYRYLDRDIFGTISNDVFTVGHPVIRYHVEENPELEGYAYVCHKDFNKLDMPKSVGFGIAFRSADAEKIQVDIMMFRFGYLNEKQTVVGRVEYPKLIKSLTFKKGGDYDWYSQVLARTLNKLSEDLLAYVERHPEYKQCKPYNAE